MGDRLRIRPVVVVARPHQLVQRFRVGVAGVKLLHVVLRFVDRVPQITEFLQEIETEAKERKLEIKDKEKFYTDSVMSLILFFIKPEADAATLKVPVQILEEKKAEEEDNGKPADN